MDTIFHACVAFLETIGNATGLSYEAVNVLIFVFALPVTFVAMAARLIYLEQKLSVDGRARELVGPVLQILGGLFLILILLFQFA